MSRKKVIVAAMDWGLGHATRCIPVVRTLLDLDCEVVLAGSGPSLKMMQLEFQNLQSLELPGYDPVYPRSGSMPWAMMKQLPGFIRVIREEHKVTERFAQQYNVNLVISDNRFGCWSDRVPSVIISHQLHILLPTGIRWMEGLVNRINHRLLSRFNECWIPDFSGSPMSGKLSISKVLNADFIGILSRFDNDSLPNRPEVYDVGVVLSGPEPQRSLLEDILLGEISSSGLRCWMVRGVVGKDTWRSVGTVEVADHVNALELQHRLLQTEMIISRSGYSTIMDLARLGKKAVFIPTPGQTEQEYLAELSEQKKQAPYFRQPDFSLTRALQLTTHYSGLKEPAVTKDLLREKLQAILQLEPVLTLNSK